MKCDNCGSINTYVKEYKHKYNIKGKKIEFISERRFCSNCNSLVYDQKLDNEASLIAISIYNKEYGIYKDDIINLRKRYNLSQELFSKIIGCAKKTLISYEKGKSIPNEIYSIILKSLIANPEIIHFFIEANKENFTVKEINIINNKININKKLNNDTTLDNDINEFNGYTKLSIEKIYNMILFFANKSVLKTKLLKEMFYADFINYKKTCKSITGLEYYKITYGPVPNNYEKILNECKKEDIINYDILYSNDLEYCNIKAKKEYNSKVFTSDELKILKAIKNKFEKFGSKEIADYSHQERAFTETDYNNKISYDYAFDIEL